MGRMLTSTIAIICGLAAIAPAGAQTVEQPLRAVSDPGIITTRQAITPAGVQTVFDGRVFATTFGEGNVLWL